MYQILHLSERGKKRMADLDSFIRSMAKPQIKALTAAAKQQHGRLMGMAAKAKDRDAKDRYRHLAKSTLINAAAAARRLHISAENAADSYRRAMKRAAEEQAPEQRVKKPPVKKSARKKG